VKINVGKALHEGWRRVFERIRRQAERLLDKRPGAALVTAVSAYEKALRLKGPLKRLLDDIHGLVRLVRAWVRGEYRTVSKRTIVLVVGALLYLVCPVDAILDTIPFAGLIDDAAVLGWVLSQVRSEIEVFAAWEATRSTRTLTAMTEASSPA
jgi:uncharacterized membrane protein YkvA (DUF1232 family)